MTRTEREIRGVFEKDADIEVLRHCNPNRHGIIALCSSAKFDLFYVVQEQIFDEGDTDWDVWDFADRESAESLYDGLMKDRSETPNWDMQAEYDDLHGTINGEDPGIVAIRELWGELQWS